MSRASQPSAPEVRSHAALVIGLASIPAALRAVRRNLCAISVFSVISVLETASAVNGDTMTSYRFVERIDDRLRADLMELHRHEWWTNTRREEDVVRMLAHTDLVVGACDDSSGQLVGFARVLTDRTFKALVFDVIVEQGHRNTGLGKRLVQYVLDHPMLAQVAHIELYCRPELIPFYTQWGFSTPGSDVNFMRRARNG
jgi:GNAT superfamily N-acetyltransferase